MSSPLLTSSRLRDLLDIFVFMERHQVSLDAECLEDKFVLREGMVILMRPWELERDAKGEMLLECQRATFRLFKEWDSLSEADIDFWERFDNGISPMRLQRHPASWSLDRAKCFILDVADARFDLKIEGPIQETLESSSGSLNPPFAAIPNWVEFMESQESGLKSLIDSQKAYYAEKGKNKKKNKNEKDFPFKGDTLTELGIFLSNIVSRFHSLFRSDISTKI